MNHKILVLGNYKDAPYHPLGGVDTQLKQILPDMELVCTDDTSTILSLEVEGYHGVISYLDIWNSSLTDEETTALRTFVENGGALLVLHNGISIQNQQALKEMVGAAFVGHPPREDIAFELTLHEITKGCAGFTLFEEPYQFELVQDEKEIFMSYLYRGKSYVAGWSKNFGKGRIVYLTPGHTAESFECPEYGKLIRNSMEWCLEGKCV